MYGLTFETRSPVVASAPNRADIALFAGFTGRRRVAGRPTPLPRAIAEWLMAQGWGLGGDGRPLGDAPARLAAVEPLLNLPVPLDSWDVFDQLFDWDERDLDGVTTGPTYLGAAVRSFFAQGGRDCYVVRAGGPWRLTEGRAGRLARLRELIPGYPGAFAGSPVDRASWRGVAHLFGLPDVSFLCLPDLADAVAVDRERTPLPERVPVFPEGFVECSEGEPPAGRDRASRRFHAPRCDDGGYEHWAQAVSLLAGLLRARRREVQLIAALPLPAAASGAAGDPLRYLTTAAGWQGLSDPPLSRTPDDDPAGVASAFVQLVYPWLRTPGSVELPEGLESPDAALAGILARNALARGSFRAAAGLPVGDVTSVEPVLRRDQLFARYPDTTREGAASHSLFERVTLFGPAPGGLALLSDVTAALQESYRPAAVNRLVAAIVRAARRLGEELVFEPAGEALWGQVRQGLEGLMLRLFEDGALRGATAADAFTVQCDRALIGQNDLDAGRVIARVQFDAAAPIERITVVLAMEEGGGVSLVPVRGFKAEAA